jgi:hypothetical protein
MELQMERERGEREQLLASILDFDQPAPPAPSALPPIPAESARPGDGMETPAAPLAAQGDRPTTWPRR